MRIICPGIAWVMVTPFSSVAYAATQSLAEALNVKIAGEIARQNKKQQSRTPKRLSRRCPNKHGRAIKFVKGLGGTALVLALIGLEERFW
jgi:hypothetical protein